MTTTINKTPDLVLVVDDNEIKRYTTCRILERAGFTVEEAVNATDTLARIYRTDIPQPRLMILDVKLPDMNGLDLCRKIKADPTTASILICHLSAHLTTGNDHAQGLESGADGYLTIPVDHEVLIATVRSLARLAHAEEEVRNAARHWKVTFDAITDAICLLDERGSIVRGNRAMAELLHTSEDSLVGTMLVDRAQNTLDISLTGVVAKAESQGIEVELPGEQRWLRISVDPVREGRGEAGYRVCILSDITSRKLLEEQQNVRYEREKRIAETFQTAFLTRPSSDAFPGFDVEAFYLSAWKEAQVGGDFFDAFLVGEGEQRQLVLAVGDASGKGLDAAVRAAEVKHILRVIVQETPEPAEALRRMNKYVCTVENEKVSGELHAFITLALATIDQATGATKICQAGAEPPLFVDANGQASEIPGSGMPLGVMPEAEFETTYLQMLPGDILMLATDGITEARQKRASRTECFGGERLVRTVREAHESKDPTSTVPLRGIGEAVLDAARDFAEGTFQDDVCLLMVRHMGQ